MPLRRRPRCLLPSPPLGDQALHGTQPREAPAAYPVHTSSSHALGTGGVLAEARLDAPLGAQRRRAGCVAPCSRTVYRNRRMRVGTVEKAVKLAEHARSELCID